MLLDADADADADADLARDLMTTRDTDPDRNPDPTTSARPTRPKVRAAVPFTAAETSDAVELMASPEGGGMLPRHPVVRGADGTVEAWSIRMILADPEGGPSKSPRTLARAAEQGRLFRIRAGVYAEPESWNAAFPAQRHLASAFAIAATRRRNPSVFCRETALLFHGLGFWSIPTSVCSRARTLGDSGHQRPTKPEGMRYAQFQETRHLKPRQWSRLAESMDGAASPWPTASPLLWGTERIVLAGVTVVVERLALALADAIPRMDPVEAAVILDALMSARRTGAGVHGKGQTAAWSKESLDALWGLSVSVTSAQRLRAKTRFASPETESAGESASRVVIRDLGFEVPELQHSVYDHRGRLIGIADFWWKDRRLVGEFDGLTKYLGRASYSGRSAEKVVTDEKIREDAIRAQGNGMVRWLASDVRTPALLEAKLRQAKVPYAPLAA
ncbi:hypothetical protein [Citricoccus muralis]|uniref:Transcriptional regulator, AbiEi antitoxin, Type IV TA system n=1 Tax=Citricoccus muralis TaxID=169134 RepID=A0A3D9LIE0_9MICC|nr:hypothetical protein [Citricoccus muralis]REE04843.1 hypothetical protein C8E99_2699 [Citricoccus muralis]